MRYLLIALALLTTMMSNAQETNTTEKANSKKLKPNMTSMFLIMELSCVLLNITCLN